MVKPKDIRREKNYIWQLVKNTKFYRGFKIEVFSPRPYIPIRLGEDEYSDNIRYKLNEDPKFFYPYVEKALESLCENGRIND